MTATRDTAGRTEVVVGVDGSESSKSALRWAARYANAMGKTVHAVIAWQPPTMFGMEVPAGVDVDFAADALTVATNAVEAALDPHDKAQVRISVFQGHPALVLVREARGADVLAVGNRGRNTFAQVMLGSVTLHCLSRAPCPVVVARNPNPQE
jgi:nucleotide-binding universal stress UspA family protein